MIQRAANGQRPTANGLGPLSAVPSAFENGDAAERFKLVGLTDSSNAPSSQVAAPESAVSKQTASHLAANDSTNSTAQDSSDTLAALAGSVFSSGRIVFTLIAGLLLFTAIAKLSMLLTDSFADVRVGISKEILWFSVLFEFGLAALNLRLKNINVLALINTVVFASFGFFAGTRWLLGYGSCGCSGNLELPAWIFITIDAAIVACFLRTQTARGRVWAGFPQLMGLWSFNANLGYQTEQALPAPSASRIVS